MTPELDSIIRGAIAGSPLAGLLGIRTETVDDDRVCLRLPFRSEVTTTGDLVHGGAIAALVDAAATAAAWSRADIGRNPRGTTIGLTLNYLAGARGEDITATATVIQRGRSVIVVEVDVRSAQGAAVSRALVTYKLDHRDPSR